ncbi:MULTISPECIES: hypothetical protein [Thermoanaerobacter]|jgi:hypothetical protein|nr:MULTISPECIES: hypothetical protein [Thermoanaerobacter]
MAVAWKQYFAVVKPKKHVQTLEIRFIVADVETELRITDIMLQDGAFLTGYVPTSKEMLKREPGIVYRHFNAVVRGNAIVAVPNRAAVDQDDITKRVTGGLDYTIRPLQDLPAGALRLNHLYKTRTFKLNKELKAGDELYFSASKRQVEINGVPTTDWEGFYHTIPAGFGRYEIEMIDPATEDEFNPEVAKPIGAAYVLFEVDTWLKGLGGERL